MLSRKSMYSTVNESNVELKDDKSTCLMVQQSRANGSCHTVQALSSQILKVTRMFFTYALSSQIIDDQDVFHLSCAMTGQSQIPAAPLDGVIQIIRYYLYLYCIVRSDRKIWKSLTSKIFQGTDLYASKIIFVIKKKLEIQ